MTLVETVRMLNRPKESALCVEYGNVKSELSAESLAWIKDKVLEEIYIGVDADEDKLAIVLRLRDAETPVSPFVSVSGCKC